METFFIVVFSFLKAESKIATRCDEEQLKLHLASKWGVPALTNLLIRCSNPEAPFRLLAAALPHIERATQILESMEDAHLSIKKSPLFLALSLQHLTFKLLKCAMGLGHFSSDDGSIGRAKSLLMQLLSRILLNEFHLNFIEDSGLTILHEISHTLELNIEGRCLFSDFLNTITAQASVAKRDIGKKAIVRLADGFVNFAIIVKHSPQIIELISSESNRDFSRFIALLESYRNTSA